MAASVSPTIQNGSVHLESNPDRMLSSEPLKMQAHPDQQQQQQQLQQPQQPPLQQQQQQFYDDLAPQPPSKDDNNQPPLDEQQQQEQMQLEQQRYEYEQELYYQQQQQQQQLYEQEMMYQQQQLAAGGLLPGSAEWQQQQMLMQQQMQQQMQQPESPNGDQSLLSHSHLKPGHKATLLSYTQTLELYRQNAKKTNDPELQFEFAAFMIDAGKPLEDPQTRAELFDEAMKLLRKLATNGHAESQHYLAECFASGFAKGKPDFDKAFPLWVQASKHGHPDAAYRTGRCYDEGLGTRKDNARAVQFYR